VVKDCLHRVSPVQDRIAELGTNAYYAEAYRDEEALYWAHIPEWIELFNAKRPLRRVLDVGCAYGTLLAYCREISACECCAIDFVDSYISPRLIAELPLQFRVCNVELDPLPWSEGFDAILFTEVLEHLNFQGGPTLRKLHNALSPGGRMYLSTPDAAEWGDNYQYYHAYEDIPLPHEKLRQQVVDDHVWHYREPLLRSQLKTAGFRILRHEYSPGVRSRHFNVEAERQV
jgi:SAM-dependent methyltransferase